MERFIFEFVCIGVVGFAGILHGCGGGGFNTTTTTTQVPEAIPTVSVPHCSDGMATLDNYRVIQNGCEPIWPTVTRLCWNSSGISISTNNTDTDIWQTCQECGCDNFAHGDVAEVFISPVSDANMAPRWYYELDVGALTGAFWGGITHNSEGDDDLYSSVFPCNASLPVSGGFASCKINCSSSLIPSVQVQNGSTWWSRNMLVSWDLFLSEFRPNATHHSPWPHWKADFFRYSYPFQENGSSNHDKAELTAWSPTYSATFHKPTRFGRVRFDAQIGPLKGVAGKLSFIEVSA